MMSFNFSFSSNTEIKATTMNDEKAFAWAKVKSQYELSSLSERNNYYIFKGVENPLTISRVYDIEWICNYDMM